MSIVRYIITTAFLVFGVSAIATPNFPSNSVHFDIEDQSFVSNTQSGRSILVIGVDGQKYMTFLFPHVSNARQKKAIAYLNRLKLGTDLFNLELPPKRSTLFSSLEEAVEFLSKQQFLARMNLKLDPSKLEVKPHDMTLTSGGTSLELIYDGLSVAYFEDSIFNSLFFDDTLFLNRALLSLKNKNKKIKLSVDEASIKNYKLFKNQMKKQNPERFVRIDPTNKTYVKYENLSFTSGGFIIKIYSDGLLLGTIEGENPQEGSQLEQRLNQRIVSAKKQGELIDMKLHPQIKLIDGFRDPVDFRNARITPMSEKQIVESFAKAGSDSFVDRCLDAILYRWPF